MFKISGISTMKFARIILGLILLSIIAVILSSCITEKKRQKICRTCPIKESTVVTDSSWQKKYDSLIKIPVKGPIIVLKDNPCADLCDSLGKVKDFTKSVVSENGIKGTIKGDKYTNTITVDCGAKDSLEVLLKGARTEINRIRNEKTVVEVPARCELDHKTKFDVVCRWCFWMWICAIIVFLIIRWIKQNLRF